MLKVTIIPSAWHVTLKFLNVDIINILLTLAAVFGLPCTAWAWFIGTTVVATSLLFYRLGALPTEVWDESRLAENALEMAKTGLSLISTYNGIPDHWNTKPPLLIWLTSISIRVLGPNEWGVRLPSAVGIRQRLRLCLRLQLPPETTTCP